MTTNEQTRYESFTEKLWKDTEGLPAGWYQAKYHSDNVFNHSRWFNGKDWSGYSDFTYLAPSPAEHTREEVQQCDECNFTYPYHSGDYPNALKNVTLNSPCKDLAVIIKDMLRWIDNIGKNEYHNGFKLYDGKLESFINTFPSSPKVEQVKEVDKPTGIQMLVDALNAISVLIEEKAVKENFDIGIKRLADSALCYYSCDGVKPAATQPDVNEMESEGDAGKVKMVVGFMFNENETDVLLIEKNKPRWQLGKLNGVGGKVEKNETYEMAMAREFQEETGISWGDWRYVITMGGDDWELQVFTAKSDDIFNYRQMEDEKVFLITLNELDDYDHISNLQWLIPLCLDKNDGKGSIDYTVSNSITINPSTP